VPEFCTCGAQLPEDARFCHKCGKPQREEDAAAEQRQVAEAFVAAITAPPPPLPEPLPVSLRNSVTMSTALMAAGVTLLLSLILGPFGLGVLALIAGGISSVFLYRQRTGQVLTVMSGMRLGWIAGIFVFAITTVLFWVLPHAEMVQQLRDQLAKSSLSSEQIKEFLEMLQTPAGISALLLVVFVSSTFLMGLGGAVGALLVRRGTADHPRI